MKEKLCGAMLLATVLNLYAAPAPTASEKLGWKLGIQAWTFNRFTFYQTVQKAKALGLRYIEAFPGQRLGGSLGDLKMGPDLPLSALATVKIWLDRAGIKLVAFGVTSLGSDEASARKVFDFAKVMGIEVIQSEPAPSLLPMIDKLCREYDIKVGLHNHPKPSRYWNPEVVLKATKGLSKYIGSCADTGHWIRSGLDPIECLKLLRGRIVAFHMKDLNKRARNAHDVPWGTGTAGIEQIMKEMLRQGFKGPVSIEYEYNWENSMPDVAKCIAYFEKVAAELLKSK